jgi:hypothetical protein
VFSSEVKHRKEKYMKLIDNDSVQSAVKEISPTHIAVAYIGVDWKAFVDPREIQQIVLSPTLGSTPHAISDLQREITWDRIFFLDELHAKIYLGVNAAVVGSFNLTRNGFDVRGLLEYGVKIDETSQVSLLRRQFMEIVELAKSKYPSTDSKKVRLAELYKLYNRAAAGNVFSCPKLQTSLEEYEPLTNNDFYIMWWRGDAVELDQAKIKRNLPELVNRELDDISEEYTNVLDSDPIEEDKWILLWGTRMDGLPLAREKLKWLYIHQVIRDVCDDAEYKTLILQRKDRPDLPPEPFSLDSLTTQAALKACLTLPEFKKYRPHPTAPWSLKSVTTTLISFVEAAQMKEKEMALKKLPPTD